VNQSDEAFVMQLMVHYLPRWVKFVKENPLSGKNDDEDNDDDDGSEIGCDNSSKKRRGGAESGFKETHTRTSELFFKYAVVVSQARDQKERQQKWDEKLKKVAQELMDGVQPQESTGTTEESSQDSLPSEGSRELTEQEKDEASAKQFADTYTRNCFDSCFMDDPAEVGEVEV
jgi:hypothetical protein